MEGQGLTALPCFRFLQYPEVKGVFHAAYISEEGAQDR